MGIFQNSVIKQFLNSIDKQKVSNAFTTYTKEFLPKIENIKSSKEEQYQYGV